MSSVDGERGQMLSTVDRRPLSVDHTQLPTRIQCDKRLDARQRRAGRSVLAGTCFSHSRFVQQFAKRALQQFIAFVSSFSVNLFRHFRSTLHGNRNFAPTKTGNVVCLMKFLSRISVVESCSMPRAIPLLAACPSSRYTLVLYSNDSLV